MISLLGPKPNTTEDGPDGCIQRTVATLDINAIETRKNTADRQLYHLPKIHDVDEVVKIGRSLSVDAVRAGWLSFISPKKSEKPWRAYFILPAEEIAEFETEPLFRPHSDQEAVATVRSILPNLSQSELAAWFVTASAPLPQFVAHPILLTRLVAVPCGTCKNGIGLS